MPNIQDRNLHRVGDIPGRGGRQDNQAVQNPDQDNPVRSSFAARYGRIILGHGVATLPTALLHLQARLDLSAQLTWFLCALLSHKWDSDLPFPSLNKMARAAGVDKTQLYDYKDRLCQMGYLRVVERWDPSGRRDTNAYDCAPLFGKLEALIASELPRPNAIQGDGDTPQFAEELADQSFTARYGRVIVRRGITAVPRALYTHGAALELTLQQVWFTTYILSYQWDTPLPYPSLKKMSVLTGYSTVQLHNIKSELVNKGYLRLIERFTPDGGQDANGYDFSPLLDAINAELQAAQSIKVEEASRELAPPDERSPRRGRKSHVPPRVSSADVGGIGFTGYRGAELPGVGGNELSGVSGRELSPLGGGYLSGESGLELSGRDKLTPASSVARGSQGTVARALHEIETINVEPAEDDSNHNSQKINKGRRKQRLPKSSPAPTRYSASIAAIVSDHSTELGDGRNMISNVTQSLRIWQESELDELEFTKQLHEARKLVRDNQGKHGLRGIENKMAYYFTCLRSLCKGRDGLSTDKA